MPEKIRSNGCSSGTPAQGARSQPRRQHRAARPQYDRCAVERTENRAIDTQRVWLAASVHGLLVMLLLPAVAAAQADSEVQGNMPASVRRPSDLPLQFVPSQSAPDAAAAPQVAQPSAAAGASPEAARTESQEPAPRLAPASEPRDVTAPQLPDSTGGALTTVISSLAIVLGLFFLVVWMMRRNLPRGLSQLPAEVVEPLGRTALAGRQQLQLIRIGRKLILLSVTPSSVETLTEISDPSEVDRLSGLCQQARPDSISSSFRQVLDQWGGSDAASSAPSQARYPTVADMEAQQTTSRGPQI